MPHAFALIDEIAPNGANLILYVKTHYALDNDTDTDQTLLTINASSTDDDHNIRGAILDAIKAHALATHSVTFADREILISTLDEGRGRGARPGTVAMTASVATETGWKQCLGQALSRTTFPHLFNAITFKDTQATTTNGSTTVTLTSTTTPLAWVGMSLTGVGIPTGATVATIVNSTTITISAASSITASNVTLTFYPHGAGDGATTFNVPDLRGRVPIGWGQGTALTDRRMGQNLGAETHALATAEMPAHTHATTYKNTSNYAGSGTKTGSDLADTSDTDTTSSTGGSGSHPNMQPSLGINFIIKT